jgi:phosphoglycerol transferase MdoB-like AlkP superfamily enzyme
MRFFTKNKNELRLKANIYVALILSLTLVMLLYSVSRIAFFMLNTAFFPDMTWSRMLRIMGGGLRFDLAATLYSNALFILLLIVPLPIRFKSAYKKLVFWTFVIFNSIAMAVNSADIIYYRFTLRRTTLSVLDQFENETNLGTLFFQFIIDYWYVFLFFIALVALLVTGARKLIRYEGPQLKKPFAFYGFGSLGFLLAIGLFIGGARGGFRESTRPITLSNAAAYATEPKDVNLVLNTPFALMRTAKANVIQKVNYFTNDEELNKVFTPLRLPDTTRAFTKKNVVVIILESFSKEFVGAYHPDKKNHPGYTPFLDSLISVSHAFQYSMANGRKSIDAMPSVIASIPSIEVPFVLSHFSGNKINSLPNLLREKGYYSAFFHGAPNGSMGFDAFARQSGFDDYFGKDEYNHNEDFDGIWGIWDEKFIQYFAEQMNTFQQPFYTNLFTLSSHHPYQLPEEYENTFKGGPRLVHRTIEYTDMALKKFFATAATMPWFKNTLFVLTADHASAEIVHPEYNTAWGYFSIPIIFYEPSESKGSFQNQLIQQVDIMPTVLSQLGYDQPYVSFGRNIFNPHEVPFAFTYLNNQYQLFQGNYLLQFDGSKSTALYDFKRDEFLKTNLLPTLPDTVSTMETKLKAFIQQYNNRMVDDNLTREGSQMKIARPKL